MSFHLRQASSLATTFWFTPPNVIKTLGFLHCSTSIQISIELPAMECLGNMPLVRYLQNYFIRFVCDMNLSLSCRGIIVSCLQRARSRKRARFFKVVVTKYGGVGQKWLPPTEFCHNFWCSA